MLFLCQVASPYGTFQMEDTNLHFLHTLEAKSNASAGWVTSGTEEFKQEVQFVEDTVVTNIEDLGLTGLIPPEVDIVKAIPIDNLWKAQKVPPPRLQIIGCCFACCQLTICF